MLRTITRFIQKLVFDFRMQTIAVSWVSLTHVGQQCGLQKIWVTRELMDATGAAGIAIHPDIRCKFIAKVASALRNPQ